MNANPPCIFFEVGGPASCGATRDLMAHEWLRRTPCHRPDPSLLSGQGHELSNYSSKSERLGVITFSGGTQTTCPSSTVSQQCRRAQIQIDFKIQNPQQEYSKVFCLSVFLQKSPLWTSHQSPEEQKRPAVWQRQERMVCGAICFGGHPKSCVWAILSYPTIPFQECTSLLFTHWAIYCPSLG